MGRVISLLIVFSLFFFTVGYAGMEGEAGSSYVLDRGVLGVVYKVVECVGKTVEAVIFGRYGVAGVKDYFQINKIFREERPKY